MYKYLLLVVLMGHGMEKPGSTLFDLSVAITHKDIQIAYIKCIHQKNEDWSSGQKNKRASENLFALGVYWKDEFGAAGITLAKRLLDQGADLNWPHIEQEFLETRRKKMIVTYTQTVMGVVRGKLREHLKEYAKNNKTYEE